MQVLVTPATAATLRTNPRPGDADDPSPTTGATTVLPGTDAGAVREEEAEVMTFQMPVELLAEASLKKNFYMRFQWWQTVVVE